MANGVYQSKYTAEQIEQKFDDVGSLNSQISLNTSELNSLSTENSTQESLISSLSTSASELNSVASSLSEENSTQTSLLSSLNTENSTQTASINSLTSETSTMSSEVDSMATATSELDSNVTELGSEVADLSDAVDEKQDKLIAGEGIAIRKTLAINSPLTIEDDSENEKTVMGVDTSGALDLSKIIPPGQRTPDEFEVAITDPQEGQVMRYNATTEQWENGDDYHVYSTSERVVGKWIDGKTIYERVITGTTGNCSIDGVSVTVNINLGVLVDKFLPMCSAMININGANVLDNKTHWDSAVTDTSSPNISNHTHKALGFYCTYRDNSTSVSLASKNSVDVNISRIAYSGRAFILLLQYTKV